MKEINKIMNEMLRNIMQRCPYPTGAFFYINNGICLNDGYTTITCIPTKRDFLVIAQNQNDTFCIYIESVQRAEDLIVEAFNTSDASARFIQRM